MASRQLELRAPERGLHRAFAIQSQPPYSTIDCLNFSFRDTSEGRRRGGSRPGMVKLQSGETVDGATRVLVRMSNQSGVTTLFRVANGAGRYRTLSGSWSSPLFYTMNNTGRICTASLGSAVYMAQDGLSSPYYFDASTSSGGGFGNAPADVATLGQVPTNCKIVAAKYGRLIFAGDAQNPRTVYASRPLTPRDFDYAETDSDAAYSETVELSGNANDRLTAIVPWHDDYCLYFFSAGIVLQRGDRPGGDYFTVDSRIGCIDSMAWCFGPNGEVYFMSSEGLAVLRGAGAKPELVSQGRMPRELVGIDPTLYEVVMAWDSSCNTLKIRITRTSSGATIGFHYDLGVEGGAFFPMQHAANCAAFAVCHLPESTAPGSSLVWGCRDGYARQDSDDASDDDGTDFDSYVWLGPVRMGFDGTMSDGVVNRLGGVLDTVATRLTTEGGDYIVTEGGDYIVTEAYGTGTANMALYVGDTAQNAYRSTARFTGTLLSGRTHNYRPRRRGVWCYVRVYGTAGVPWGLECIPIELVSGGSI